MHDHAGTGSHCGKLKIVLRQQILQLHLVNGFRSTREDLYTVEPQFSRFGAASGEVIPCLLYTSDAADE